MITQVPYTYIDGAEELQENSIIYLNGELTASDIEAIASKLCAGNMFIPGDLSKVTIEELQRRIPTFPSDADHMYHLLQLDERKVLAAIPAGAVAVSLADFVDSFRLIPDSNSWNVAAAVARLGL